MNEDIYKIISYSTEELRSELEELLIRNGLPRDELLIVDDVDGWRLKNGDIGERQYNPFRVASRVYSQKDKRYIILFRKEITNHMIDSVKGLMSFQYGPIQLDKIKDPILFIKHTMLHEIAHSQYSSEQECDLWAFDQMDKIAGT